MLRWYATGTVYVRQRGLEGKRDIREVLMQQPIKTDLTSDGIWRKMKREELRVALELQT